jgi:hypothetical protein
VAEMAGAAIRQARIFLHSSASQQGKSRAQLVRLTSRQFWLRFSACWLPQHRKRWRMFVTFREMERSEAALVRGSQCAKSYARVLGAIPSGIRPHFEGSRLTCLMKVAASQ